MSEARNERKNISEMKALIQRVTSAKVTGNFDGNTLIKEVNDFSCEILVGDELISSIGRGFCVLIGLSHDDTIKDVEYM